MVALGGALADEVEATGRSREPFAFALTCLGSLAFSAAFIWRAAFEIADGTAFVLMDDAMISMRYAENLAAGDGLVWNAGGDPVEGITNPLWTLWMALLHLLPASPFKQPLLVMLTSAALLVAVIWTARRLAQQLVPGDPLVAGAATVVAGTFYPLIFWSLLGMEVGLLAWLLGLVVLGVVRQVADPAGWRRRDTVVLALVVAAAVLTRMDALVPLAVAGLAGAWLRPPDRRAILVRVGAPAAAALALLTLARLAYYGELLPNTYYLKATGLALATRLEAGAGLLAITVGAHLAVLVLVIAFGLRRPAVTGSPVLVAVLLSQAAYSVWVGGDAWEYLLYANRYLTVGIVPAAALAGIGVAGLARDHRRLAAFCLAVAATVGVGMAVGGRAFRDSAIWQGSSIDMTGAELREELTSQRGAYLALVAALAVLGAVLWRLRALPVAAGAAVVLVTVVGLTNARAGTTWWRHASAVSGVEQDFARSGWAVRMTTRPDAVIAVWQAGAEPYFAGRPAVDLSGKSDEHVARLPVPSWHAFRAGHNKQDFEWSITTYRPDLIRYWSPDQARERWLTGQGYEPIGGAMWMLSSTTAVDVEALRQWRTVLTPPPPPGSCGGDQGCDSDERDTA